LIGGAHRRRTEHEAEAVEPEVHALLLLVRWPHYAALRDAVALRTPAGRIGTPDDVAEVVLFPCSERARWLHGQTLIADGGFSLL